MRKSIGRLKVGIGGAMAVAIAGALVMPALAHTAVADSNPQDGSTVDAAPEEVWVKFGNVPPPGEQPVAINGGHLEVFDACGEQVSSGETEMNDLQNQLTVSSGGNRAGRYELHWTVEATDGDAQAGVIDFNVSSGSGCSSVVRTDPKGDVDHGFDMKSVKATQTARELTVAQVRLKMPVRCKAFGPKSDDSMELGFDTDEDDTDDFSGVFSCKRDRFKFVVASADDGEKLVFPASLNEKGNVLTARLREFSDGEHLDLYAVASSKADECSEQPAEGEEAPVCSDRAPDLGVLRAF